jgi:hypothetical protein
MRSQETAFSRHRHVGAGKAAPQGGINRPYPLKMEDNLSPHSKSAIVDPMTRTSAFGSQSKMIF